MRCAPLNISRRCLAAAPPTPPASHPVGPGFFVGPGGFAHVAYGLPGVGLKWRCMADKRSPARSYRVTSRCPYPSFPGPIQVIIIGIRNMLDNRGVGRLMVTVWASWKRTVRAENRPGSKSHCLSLPVEPQNAFHRQKQHRKYHTVL